MPFYAVWTDSKLAKLFQFSNEKMERKILHSTQPGLLYAEAAAQLGKDGHILIAGPEANNPLFRAFLQERFPGVANRVVGCETVDNPTDPEIAAIAIKYFKNGYSKR